MDTAKIYGLCLERLKYQIRNAVNNDNGKRLYRDNACMLENYCTGNIDEIIDMLELYDIEERSLTAILEKLDELAYTVSVLTREQLFFGFDSSGSLALFLRHREADASVSEYTIAAAYAA